MLNVTYNAYPNRCGKKRTDDNRGALRVGIVEDNADMQDLGIAGRTAAVTHEAEGYVRFYSLTMEGNIFVWDGPFEAHSEEILTNK